MFSTLTALISNSLPSATREKERQARIDEEEEDEDGVQTRSGSQTPASPRSRAESVEPDDEANKASTTPAEAIRERRRRQKLDRPVNESYIIVRPPPAKNNHPLNLQIQLVPPRLPHAVAPPPSVHPTPNSSLRKRESIDISQARAEIISGAAGPSTPTSPASAASTDLRRTGSVRSTYSDRSQAFYSSVSSTGSVQSFASGAGSAHGAASRRIVPLYNLHAHNVLTNTVTDAGTDAKVAKFQKRGLEVLRVGVWEPVEVWSNPKNGNPTSGFQFNSSSGRLTDSDAGHGAPLSRVPSLESGGNGLNVAPFEHTDPTVSMTPTSSPSIDKRRSLLSKGIPEVQVSSHSRNISREGDFTPTGSPKEGGAKKLFGKVFGHGKRDSVSSLSGATLSPPGSPRNSFLFGGRDLKKNSSANLKSLPSSGPSAASSQAVSSAMNLAPSNSSIGSNGSSSASHSRPFAAEASLGPPSSASHQALSPEGNPLQPPVLGIQATVHSSTRGVPSGRPTSYVWLLQKWAKEKLNDPTSLLKGLAANLHRVDSFGSEHRQGPIDSDVDIRFEWTRGTSASLAAVREKKIREKSMSVSSALAPPSPNASRSSLGREEDVTPGPRTAFTLTNSRRGSTADAFPMTAPSEAGSYDPGEESDPEDSETPWTCTLHIYPSHMSPLTEREAKERALAAQSFANDEYPSDVSSTPAQRRVSIALPPHDGRLRLRLAVLIPTPHHPKIIGQFKTPFPLPDVAITPRGLPASVDHSNLSHIPSFLASHHAEQTHTEVYANAGPGGRFLPRALAQDGSIQHANRHAAQIDVSHEILLTAEDLKDVVSTTGLWLVVREGFGGLGKVKRRGDGWQIRS